MAVRKGFFWKIPPEFSILKRFETVVRNKTVAGAARRRLKNVEFLGKIEKCRGRRALDSFAVESVKRKNKRKRTLSAAENGEAAIRQETVGDLAAEWLFGESSELYMRLYEQGLIDGSFGGGFETVDSMAMLSCGGDSKDPEGVLSAILEQAQKLTAQGIDEADFQRMKRSALGRRLRDMDSFDSTAFRLCAYHFSKFDYFRFPEVYRAVEKEELTAFIQQVVTRSRAALSVIQPCKEETL